MTTSNDTDPAPRRQRGRPRTKPVVRRYTIDEMGIDPSWNPEATMTEFGKDLCECGHDWDTHRSTDHLSCPLCQCDEYETAGLKLNETPASVAANDALAGVDLSVPAKAPVDAPYCICGNEQTFNVSINGDSVGPLCEPFLTGPLSVAYEAFHTARREWGMCCGGISSDIGFGRSLAERIQNFSTTTHLYLHPKSYGESVYCVESPEDPCRKCRDEGYDMGVECGVWLYADHAQPYWIFDNDKIDTHGEEFGEPVAYKGMDLDAFLAALAAQLERAAEAAHMSDHGQCEVCGGHYYMPNGPCCEPQPVEMTFSEAVGFAVQKLTYQMDREYDDEEISPEEQAQYAGSVAALRAYLNTLGGV